MQPKVSMVVPCYNKDGWIARMLNSIIAQKWDNIELVLVNDGSTDRTRDVIEEYIPKLHARGFETIVIDQENKGVAAAIYEGLMHITGEFFCTVDADDELDPEYVSAMAGWLSEHPEDQWTVCDFYAVEDKGTRYTPIFLKEITWDRILEKWLLSEMRMVAWVYMIRADYMKRCRLLELFYTEHKSIQEAPLFFPLALGGAKPKHLPRALYRYDRRSVVNNTSCWNDYQNSKKHLSLNAHSAEQTILMMPLSDYEKQRLTAISNIAFNILGVRISFSHWESPAEIPKVVDDLLEPVTLYFKPAEAVNRALAHEFPREFCDALKDNILSISPNEIKPLDGRIIVWGALGKNAAGLIPNLERTALKPDELWDAAGDGIKIKKPDVPSLSEKDLVLVMPTNCRDILTDLKKSTCQNIMIFREIQSFVAFSIFPEFYDGSISFEP